MLRKIIMFCLFSIFTTINCPAADICDYAPEDGPERDEFYDLNPFCDNIDEHIPLDDGLPYLIAGGVVLGVVFRKHLQRSAIQA